MNECKECAQLRGESASAFCEYTALKDELAVTRKTDKSFVEKRKAFERAQGRLRECHTREQRHRTDAHGDDGSSVSSGNVEEKFSRLHQCLDLANAECVGQAIFDLSPIRNSWDFVPDEVVERLLALLSRDEMFTSPHAGQVLNYFEFEADKLSASQKLLCIQFLKTHGDKFAHVHSQQVVAELRHGKYLSSPSPD